MEASINKSDKIDKRSKHPYLKIFVDSMLLYCICIAPFIILSKGVYLTYGDFNAQEIPFWIHICNTLRDGLPAYDWTSDLGLNFWGSYTYFGLTDPFQLMGLLFPKEILPYGITLIQILKVGLCGLTSYIYIRPHTKKEISAYIGAVLYTFSGQQLFSMCFIFSQIYAVFPLLLYSFDKLVKERKSVCFALLLALMGMINYYFLFSSCVFILIYFLVKVRCGEYKIDIKLFAKIAAETLMGILLCAVSLLPAYYVLKNNYRAGSFIFDESLLYYPEAGTLLKVFLSAFLPPDICSSNGVIGTRTIAIANISLFLPFFFLIGVAAVFRRNKKTWYSRLLTLCAVMACLPLLNSMFYAFNSTYYARWFYMPMLIMCAMTGKYIDDFQDVDIKKELKFSALIVAAYALLGLPDIIRNDTLMIVMSIGYSAVALLMLFALRYKDDKFSLVKLKRFTCAFAVVPFIIHQMYLLNTTNLEHTERVMAQLYNDMQEVRIDDYGFYRLSQENHSHTNYTLLWGLPSIDLYHNLIPVTETEFYHTLNDKGFLNHYEDETGHALHSFLSVKYHAFCNLKTAGGVDIEPEDIQLKRYGFKLMDVQGRQVIYKNENFIPMGFTYDYYLDISSIVNSTQDDNGGDTDTEVVSIEPAETERRERLLLKAIWLDSEQTARYSDMLAPLPEELEEDTSDEAYEQDCQNRINSAGYEFSPDKNGFTSKIRLDKPNLVFYSVPYDEGWTAYVDGQQTQIEKVFAGLCAVPVGEGDHTVRFDYKVTWLKEGIIITSAAGSALIVYSIACLIIYLRKKDKKTKTKQKAE